MQRQCVVDAIAEKRDAAARVPLHPHDARLVLRADSREDGSCPDCRGQLRVVQARELHAGDDTFGTLTGAIGTGVYRAAVEALADLPVRVLMSTGQDLDLGVLPANVHVCRWIGQADVFAEASAVLCHGGSGTALGALGAGIPIVIYPLFADQLPNAEALEQLGVAVLVEPAGASAAERSTYDPASVPALRAAVDMALHAAPLRWAAQRIEQHLAHQPTPRALLMSLQQSHPG